MHPLVRSILFSLPPESAHNVATGAARLAQSVLPRVIDSAYSYAHPRLHMSLFGKQFTNPVGLAAGFDKNAQLITFWRKLGFGFVEVGSVSARRSKGNRKPRAFRLPADQALINRMGLNNHGVARVAKRVQKHAGTKAFPIGVNIAKTNDPALTGEAGIEDFCITFRTIAPFADYIALNVSCPNTEDGKTFEDPNTLDDLLRAVMREREELIRKPPVLVKLSPPLMDAFVLDSLIDELIMVSMAHGVNGFIASNTAPDREHLVSETSLVESIGRGGLSGLPIQSRSTQLVRYLYRKTKGQTPIIGVGGIASAEAAYSKIRAGASLVQLYTGLVYNGPGLVREIKQNLVRLLQEDGFSAISKAVGLDT